MQSHPALRHVALALALALPSVAAANDSVFGGCSGAGAVMAEGEACRPTASAQIALVDEKLVIVQTKFGWRVDAAYTLKNTGDATKVTVGFPVARPAEPGDDEEVGDGEPKKRQPPLSTYEVTLDDARLKWWPFFPEQQGDEGAKKAAADFGYDTVYLVELPFAKDQQRVLRHRYEHASSGDSIGVAWLSYILRTGGFWQGGTIGAIAIDVTLARPPAPGCFGVSLRGSTWDAPARTLRFRAKDFKPTVDLLATWVDARHRSSQELSVTAEVLGLSALDLDAKRSKTLADAPADKLVAYYHAILGLYRGHADALPQYPADMCAREGIELFKDSPLDPGLRLQDLDDASLRYVKRLDKELTRRGVAHAPLPKP